MRLPLLIAALIGLAAPAANAQEFRISGERPLGPRTIELTIETPAFTAPTRARVYLPAGYDTDPKRRWPVTYYLAGTNHDEKTFEVDWGMVPLIKDFAAIVVTPKGDSGYWHDWFNGGAFGPPRYATFVVRQLIPMIDARFRTIDDRGGRAVMGESMGGFGAAGLAARHPDVFGAAVSISGLVDSNVAVVQPVISGSSSLQGGAPDAIFGPRATEEIRWRGANPWDLAENLRHVDVQLLSANGLPGNAEEVGAVNPLDPSCVLERGVYETTVSMHNRLDALGKAHVFTDYGNACHTAPNFRAQLTDALPRLVVRFADPAPASERFTHLAIEPRFDVWGWRVEADPARALEFLRFDVDPDGVTLEGSGRTAVVTPPSFAGLRAVDVDGAPVAPEADGRLRLTVDLGPAHAVQQYTPGASATFERRRVALAPHAVLRITRVARVRRGLRVCARTLGGPVPRARIAVRDSRGRRAARSVHMSFGARTRCRRMPTMRRGRYTVSVSGRDRFGHAAAASARR